MGEAPFRRLGLAIKSGDTAVGKTLQHLQAVLKNIDVQLCSIGKPDLPINAIPTIAEEQIAARCDLVVVIGGDGSFLRFAKAVAIHNVPLLGINCGRVGFLTDIAHDDIAEQLPRILRGDCLRDEHILLQGTLSRSGETLGKRTAFNDLVMHSGSGRMLEMQLFVDDQFVYREHSDGIIAATPHGSTAYALSAGGPIIVPPAQVVALVNISPQTLTSRPLLLPYMSKIRIDLLAGKDVTFYADGWQGIAMQVGDQIEIAVAEQTVKLIHPCNYDFYTACRNKLDWQARKS